MKDYMESYVNCILCPRNCRVNRLAGERGFCGQSEKIRIARAALHFWEEPVISGEMIDGKNPGSGAVFFSGCNLKCIYCQNHDISAFGKGYDITTEELADEFLRLQSEGALNINLVTAAMFVPSVICALDIAKEKGLKIPVVYNSSGYESVETLKMLEGYVDLYLPDLKYLDTDMAAKLSGAPDYPEVAKAAIAEMVRQSVTGLAGGACVTGDVSRVTREKCDSEAPQKSVTGDTSPVTRGKCDSEAPRESVTRDTSPVTRSDSRVIVRHLVLPGHTKESMNVIKYLYDTYGDDIYISIMSQYTPLENVLDDAACRHVNGIGGGDFAELKRRITKREYEKVVDYALSLGVKNAYIQEREVAKESFIPEFYDEKKG